MSCIGTSTSYSNNTMMNNTNNKVQSGMMNSIEKIDPTIRRLIDLTTGKEHTMEGTCIMAVALHQQGIYDLNTIQSF